jgi:CrcB protein
MEFLRSKNMQTVFWITLGAVLGANLRYWFGIWAGQRWGTAFPYATLFINLTGSLVLGFFMTVVTERFLVDPRWRIFFATGFLGSFTTFSTYTYESISLLMTSNWSWGLLNLLGSAVLGGLAAVLGMALGRLV